MLILGIDPGTTTVGYCLLQKDGRDIKLVEADAIKTVPKLEQAEKILIISDKLKKIIDIHRPSVLAIEKVFFFKNNKTAMSVAEAKGAIILTAKNLGLKVYEYTPLEVKMALTGYGRADKKQVEYMVKNVLKLETTPKLDDITDAMAIAITCANSTTNMHE